MNTPSRLSEQRDRFRKRYFEGKKVAGYFWCYLLLLFFWEDVKACFPLTYKI